MSPEEFTERFAYYLLSGVGDHRQHVGLIASETHNLMLRLYQMKTGKNVDLADEDDFVPKLYRSEDHSQSSGKIDPDEPGADIKIARGLGFNV